jgi:hypothetical protein
MTQSRETYLLHTATEVLGLIEEQMLFLLEQLREIATPKRGRYLFFDARRRAISPIKAGV